MGNADSYAAFLASKAQVAGDDGFEALWVPEWLFGFQRELVMWSLAKGRAAIFADCGLGKTPMQLVWAENVVRKTNRPVLVLTPLAVGRQTVREAEKFGVDAVQSRDGKWKAGARVVVTNYERLHYFDAEDFAGVVCDESSILKNFAGVTREQVTEFMRTRPYRLLCTATAAPNDFTELGTSSEALGYMGHMDMLSRFFRDNGRVEFALTSRQARGESACGKYRFRGHAERDFWRYVCSWARAIRRPGDMGFDDGKFRLPELRVRQHVIQAITLPEGWLMEVPAATLQEQRAASKRTLAERCEMAAGLVVDTREPAVMWCNTDAESALLSTLVTDAVEVRGSMADEAKEEALESFARGESRVMVTKPTIAGFGLNWQHCSQMTYFPSHSYEQYYQSVRRCWRFGQRNRVTVDVVSTEGEGNVLANLQRKEEAANRLFDRLVALMNNELRIQNRGWNQKEEVPLWL